MAESAPSRHLAGNASVAAVVVKLDTRAPLVSLDPPRVRFGKLENDVPVCSDLFDPVGEDSVNDGDVVGSAAEFRARIEDLGNGAQEAEVVFLATIAEDDVLLYLAPAGEGPLLVDEDGDGICDGIHPDREPRSGNPLSATVVPLGGVRPRGREITTAGVPANTFPASEASYYEYGETTAFERCAAPETSRVPDPVCGSTPLTRIIGASGYSQPPPAIYAKPPIQSDTTCAGDSFDFRETLPEGWTCAAAMAPDELGNVGLSAPIRVCFSDQLGADPCGAPVGSTVTQGLPACTDGCEPPLSFRDFPWRQLVY